MNYNLVIKNLTDIGYKKVPEYDNSYYLWVSTHARITFIFNLDNDIGYAYLAFRKLISNKNDLKLIKEAYTRMQNDAKMLSDIGVEIHDLQSI